MALLLHQYKFMSNKHSDKVLQQYTLIQITSELHFRIILHTIIKTIPIYFRGNVPQWLITHSVLGVWYIYDDNIPLSGFNLYGVTTFIDSNNQHELIRATVCHLCSLSYNFRLDMITLKRQLNILANLLLQWITPVILVAALPFYCQWVFCNQWARKTADQS